MKKLITPFIVFAVVLITTISTLLYLGNSKLESTPEISLNIIDGRKIDLHSLKGTPLFVTFWATTCSICVKEMPHLAALYNELGREKLEIIAIAMPYDPPNLVLELTERKNIPYPVALDIHGVAVKAFGDIQLTPTSFLIDQEGNIIEQTIGEVNIEELRKKIESLLKTTTTIS
jgi:peroxiredoxin